MPGDLIAHFQMLARYNRIVNERLFELCAGLSDKDYRKERFGSFGSIHRTLNHILLGDRIWMSRFEGGGSTTPPLHTILYEEFDALRKARDAEDARIEQFFANAPADFLDGTLSYTNSLGKQCADPPALAVAHMFNHQTHHRGQIHVMLSVVPVKAPSLDMHRVIRP